MRPQSPRTQTGRVCFFLLATALLQGCFFSFDFPTGPSATTGDAAGDVADAGVDSGGEDVSVGMDATQDMPPDMQVISPAAVGGRCESDEDCEGECYEGYCTMSCLDVACPEGAACVAMGDALRCAVECGPYQACEIPERDDLSCLDDRGTAAFEAGAFGTCLPDGDGDGWSDFDDNCPEAANPTQADGDGDGEGDACDDANACDATANGRIDYDPMAIEARGLSVPDFAGRALPMFGGAHDDGTPADVVASLSRTSGQWAEGKLPYAATGHASAWLPDGTFLLTPGASSPGAPQLGRFLVTTSRGEVAFAANYDVPAFDPVIAATKNGVVWMIAYTEAADTGSHRWRVYRGSAHTGMTAADPGGQFDARLKWRATRTRHGTLYFYSQVTPENVGYFVEVEPEGQVMSELRAVTYPADMNVSSFDPFWLPGPGGQMFVYERSSGRAYVFDPNQAIPPTPRRVGTVDIGVQLDDMKWIALERGPAFVVMGRSPDDPTSVSAIEYRLPCMGDSSMDSDLDGDGLGPTVDNCPLIANADQADMDDDDVGDACDADLDGDGIRNEDDVRIEGEMVTSFAEDTDNDGIANADDDDDDGDGIADAEDPSPLNTDNDAIANAYDRDDDDDGYSDGQERQSGSNPHDRLSFPGSGTIVFVRDDGNARSVEVGPLSDVSSAQPLALTGAGPAYLPRFGPTGENVLILDGEPGTTTRVEWLGVMSGQGAIYELGMPLRGATAVAVENGQLSELIATQERFGVQDAWQIVRFKLQPLGFVTLVNAMSDIGVPDEHARALVFAAAPAGCDSCRAVYRTGSDGGTPALVTASVPNPRLVRYTGAYAMVGDSAGGGSAAFVQDSSGEFRELRPAGAAEVDSVVASASQGHALVSARGDGESFDLWFYNGVKGTWILLMNADADLVQVDWAQ